MKSMETFIIEDNPGDVFILNEQLKNAGWQNDKSQHKSNLSESIDLLHNIKPAVIFLDLNLPDSNGLDTFIAINKHIPDVPVIILSGMNDTLLALEAVKAGAQDFLVKGEYDEKMLLKTITYCIERKKNQLKTEEENIRYQLVSNATNDPLWDWDMRTNNMYWNDKVSIFGYGNLVNKDERWRIDAIHPEDREKVKATLEDCLTNNHETCNQEYRFICADGSLKYILDRWFIVRDRNNMPYRMIGTMQDQTEKILLQKHIEEEEQKQQQYILKANIDGQEQERDHISKELHDNVNQVLTGVKLHLSLIKPDDKNMMMGTVTTCVGYLDDAIEEIRKLTRAMSSSVMKEMGLIEAMTVLKDETRFLKVCNIKFVHSGDFANTPVDISLSIFRIAQEHLNNIIKHSQASNVVISLDIIDCIINLRIMDDGIGADLTDRQELKGIGIPNIRNRVLAHNGTIDIRSNPGEGFEVSIELSF